MMSDKVTKLKFTQKTDPLTIFTIFISKVEFLRKSDPPDQYGPVPQTKLYLGNRQPDPTRGELHKE